MPDLRHETRIALTIAGSDPSGGAGIEADLKTFHQLRVFGTAVVTLIAVQNTVRVHRVAPLDEDLVGDQIDAVLEDLPPHAAKTGALGNSAIVTAIAERRLTCPLVVDPVMISSRGVPLLDDRAQSALASLLLPQAALITPNLHEAAVLAGIPVTTVSAMKQAARRIADLGADAVLVKGGHLAGDTVDVLFFEGDFYEFPAPRIHTRHTHGTGCTYSAAITAHLANGLTIPEAVLRAHAFVQRAIASAPGLGAGSGPLSHWV